MSDLWINKDREPHEINPDYGQTIQVNLSFQPTIISKEYGPTSFARLRITPTLDGDFFGWLIEREMTDPGMWVPILTLPGQVDLDYMAVSPDENEGG